MKSIKILFLADTHLGIDLPLKPRINRRRRGLDFFKNYELALKPALEKKVDLVIHGGDLYYRSKLPDLLINMAFEPLLKIADLGIPVILVPGNHERSKIRLTLFELHENIFIFTKPEIFKFKIRNCSIQIAGFPCIRKNVRDSFVYIIAQLKLNYTQANISLLCMHQAVEGAQVGPSNYTFRKNHDTIRAVDIPGGFAAILSGHIHRHQVLKFGPNSKPLNTKVFYPGSIERTAFAEKNESKGYIILDIETDGNGGHVKNWKFHELPSRPMIEFEIDNDKFQREEILKEIEKMAEHFKKDSILRIKFSNIDTKMKGSIPGINDIRRVIPETMNVQIKSG